MGFDIGSFDFLAKKPLEEVFSYADAAAMKRTQRTLNMNPLRLIITVATAA